MNNLDSVEGQLAAEVIGWQQANDRHVIERDEARAKLARIAALCDSVDQFPFSAELHVDRIRAVLDGDPT